MISKQILVIHGPNINLLGQREPNIYGTKSLNEINKEIKLKANKIGLIPNIFHSNSEGNIIDFIQQHARQNQGIIFNFGAYTHTSIALRDCLLSYPHLKKIEVHLSNIYTRENFRQHSLFHDISDGIISGFKNESYILALYGLLNLIG